jgi:hypothetical protein
MLLSDILCHDGSASSGFSPSGAGGALAMWGGRCVGDVGWHNGAPLCLRTYQKVWSLDLHGWRRGFRFQHTRVREIDCFISSGGLCQSSYTFFSKIPAHIDKNNQRRIFLATFCEAVRLRRQAGGWSSSVTSPPTSGNDDGNTAPDRQRHGRHSETP